jgi:membrane peptidoglycan carboxypeptidase
MPRTTILSITDSDGNQVYPDPSIPMPKPREVISPQAAYIITDILAGNTNPKVNPFWAEWAVYDGRERRPAAYKTGTTNDNRDTHAYGYLAPPDDPSLPALAVGVWMGNSNNEPNTDTLSLASSAPLWSRIMRDVSKDLPIQGWHVPSGLETATVDAFTGMRPGPFTSKTVKELFIKGTAPSETDSFHRSVEIDMASGLLWQEGCVGPKRTLGALDFTSAEEIDKWAQYNRGWQKRAARGSGVSGGPEGTRTSYFYGSGFYPFGRSWGGIFAPTDLCPIPEPEPPQLCGILFLPPCPSDQPPPGNDKTPKPPGNKTPKP